MKLAYIVNKAITTITLKNVKYAPQLCINLLSIPAALSNGYNIGNEGQYLYLQKGNFKLKFDKLFSSGKSLVCGIYMQPILQDAVYPALEEGTQIKLTKVHEMLGHYREDATRATAKYYGWKTTGNFKPCEDCGIGKAKQAAVNKELNLKSEIPGERWFIDISSVKGASFGGTKFWFGMLDDCTDLFILYCIRAKSKLAENLVLTLQTMTIKHRKHPKYIRCDDAGENHKAEKACIKAGIKIQFEYTPLGTPQRNRRIEKNLQN